MPQKGDTLIEREIIKGLLEGKHPVYTSTVSAARRLYRICVGLGYHIDGPNMNRYPLEGPYDSISGFFKLDSTSDGKKYILAIITKHSLFQSDDAIYFPEFIFKL